MPTPILKFQNAKNPLTGKKDLPQASLEIVARINNCSDEMTATEVSYALGGIYNTTKILSIKEQIPGFKYKNDTVLFNKEKAKPWIIVESLAPAYRTTCVACNIDPYMAALSLDPEYSADAMDKRRKSLDKEIQTNEPINETPSSQTSLVVPENLKHGVVYRPYMNRSDRVKIAVHDGQMHADDAMCVGLMTLVFPNAEIWRTRDPKLLDIANFRLDVAGRFDPENGYFDHHQNGFAEYHPLNPYIAKEYNLTRGPLRCGFGLVWLFYGREAINNIIQGNIPQTYLDKTFGKHHDSFKYIKDAITPEIIEKTFNYLDKTDFAAISAHDNGQWTEFDMRSYIPNFQSFSAIVQIMNPPAPIKNKIDPGQYRVLQDEAFERAVEMARIVIINAIKKSLADAVSMNEAYAHSSQALYTNGVIITHRSFSKKQDFIKKCARYRKKKIDALIEEDKTVAPDEITYKPKYYLTLTNDVIPQKLQGLTEQELNQKYGLEGILFISKSGTYAGTRTAEQAMRLVDYVRQQ